MKRGTIFTTPNDFVDHDKKLRLNMPEGTLRRFSYRIEFRRLFSTEDLLELIFDQTKLYNEWQHLNFSEKTVQNIQIEDKRKVIGSVLYMDIVRLPSHGIYWNRRCGNELISDDMSQNRFDEILIVLHFNDYNAIQPGEDPL